MISIDGQPWFIAAEICRILGVGRRATGGYNVGAATTSLDATEKQNLPYLEAKRIGLQLLASRAWGISLVSESGLYKMTMRSDKREARPFQD